ncbi:hypothetical protein [Inquilinus limosus]|uniref:Uncharacterized protein n=1 Tax=Inquilinus limosus TaxID=171674 RepID=A0A211ZKU4_9PROT|nr:hypothetical protein [Inquilinus limosus]OWJ65794.1 hypothetical protein BWR60_18085 [Inquilinus limosus]
MERGAESDLDVQAYCRSLALQQIQMLTRLAEIAMQLAEAEGARAIAAQVRAAAPKADEVAVRDARAEAQEAGMAFSRFSRSVHRSLALRSRAADSLCARDKAQAADREAARQDRRDRHRNEVERVLRHMIWDEIEDFSRVEALHAELEERVEDLYDDETLRVEDRPVGSVMSGLACGLGLTEEWGRWSPAWPGTPDPARPAGDAAKVEAERARRRDAAVAAVERSFADLRDPARIPGIRAGLAARVREADVIAWLDTETTQTVARRLCRSLGIDPYNCFEKPDSPDTG